ncbi:MAG: putative oxidoreductase [Nocardia sp.]|uniref:malonic semialdehyde reductase n=1 Tax=Nocardia sp. TaxID=1821 RepID=UPI002638B515|nr:malonic semialdehyde reductase [Nocardia sp.]MCU1648051.1 putative oxidoreductase [Nocardia sp.]
MSAPSPENLLEPLCRLDEAGLATLFTEARTANSFADTPVTDEELRNIWELARWAPTQSNIQPLRVLYARTPEGRARVMKHLSEGNQPKSDSAAVIAVLATDTRFHEHMPELLPFRPGIREVYESAPEWRATCADFNSALQAGYFILAVRALGLAAGPMKGFDAAGFDADFFPDGRLKSTLVVNIGHPSEQPWFQRLPRLEHEQVITWV